MASEIFDSIAPVRARERTGWAPWLLFAMLAAPLSIAVHELGHYFMAQWMGATDIVYHWAAVTFNEEQFLAPFRLGLIAITGPIVSYAITLLCWRLTRDRLIPFVAALGFFAPMRGLVGLGFIIQRGLGRLSPGLDFDELEAARNWGITPFITVLISLAVLIFGVQFFSRKVWREKGALAWVAMFAGSLIGLYLWTLIGPIIFPGGYGFE